MDSSDALEWLYARQGLGIKLGLEKVRRMLATVGNPQDDFQSIHVAGTNGKGSVTTFLAAALQQAGHKVGRFTSPHLIRFSERIVVDGEEIPSEAVVRFVQLLQPETARLDDAGQHPTFFELVTAIAFLWFKEQAVDWAVIETGMGGRLDATNVLTPALCIITNVGMDHQAFLGEHIVDIASEKAGIMKPGIPCITGARGEALLVLKAVSQVQQCPMSILGEDYHAIPDIGGLSVAHPGGSAHYDVSAAGEHQLQNAALVVAACDALRLTGVQLPVSAVQLALANTTMPGRMETMQFGDAAVLLDSAHNLDGAIALRRHLAHLDEAGFQLIVGFSADKAWADILAQWAPLAARVIGIPLRSSRSLAPESMRTVVEGIGIPFATCANADEALRLAAEAAPERIVIAGSLFLVGEARAVILGEALEEIRGNQ